MTKQEISKLLNKRSLRAQILSALFFPLAILYHELILRIFDSEFTSFFSAGLIITVLFSLAGGLLISLLLDVIPNKKVSRIIGIVLIAAQTVIFCIERGCRSLFGLYFGITTVSTMTGNALGGFGGFVWSGFLSIIPFFLLSLIPLAVFIVFNKVIISDKPNDGAVRISMGSAAVVCHIAALLMSLFGGAKNYFTYDFTANNAVPNFGLGATLRMEIEYAVIGIPEPELGGYIESNTFSEQSNSSDSEPAVDSENSEDSSSVSEEPKVYGYNQMNIDFDALSAQTNDKTLKSMHEYFKSLSPSQQNKYTGMFKGKNLIFITAEAFSPYFISEELTPTLYRLTHEGFVFNNYYQPDWTQSTVGGEVANITGIIPSWINGKWASAAAANDYMPFTIANRLSALGYSTPAWHNHTYNYYDRNKYLPAFGYDYKGAYGGGLTIPSEGCWPESDLEMIEATVDGYTDDFINQGTPFSVYYMTVSAHAEYNFGGNDMAKKNKEIAQAAYPDASEAVQAYVASSLELEYAMEHLVNTLEEKGIADDTLIVLTADHYPYALASGNTDYYNELRGFTDTELVTSRYKNSLIMWSGCIEEPIEINTPCYSVDILPTLLNLFGLEYDSRIIIGRDIFAENYDASEYSSCMPLVIFANNHGQGNSWITAAGVYEASTGIFTPNEGITVNSDYVSRVNRLVEGKVNYSKLILSKNYYKSVFPQGFEP